MTVRYIMNCGNPECDNYKCFVNEPEFDFSNENEEESWRQNYGQGTEDIEDFCPFCGQLAILDDVIEIFEEDKYGARN